MLSNRTWCAGIGGKYCLLILSAGLVAYSHDAVIQEVSLALLSLNGLLLIMCSGVM